MARVTFVTSGLEHLGVEALSSWVRAHGHEPALVYEPKLFSSDSGPNSATLARLLEPSVEETAARVAATRPDVVAFSSYTITHRWAVAVARAVKRSLRAPVVFGGPHVSGAPGRAIREPSIDAVVEGEGEGALLDLLACAERDRFGRSDIPNVWCRGRDGAVISNPLRPLIQDLDALPYADKRGFYAQVPAFEREYYVISRRGCPYRCSFCEYSTFPEQYPGERPVRRRSVAHLLGEMRPWAARGRVRKVFFWDAIFTLDLRWMEDFAERWRAEVALPFECYTHPQTMTAPMAALLARAGCIMVRVGVQSVNADTLAAMDRRGDQARVAQTLRHLTDAGVPYSLDHILGLPGETARDQIDALRFYNDVRPRYIHVHWMTYFPGTTALRQARDEGLLTEAEVDRVLDGEATEGFETPRAHGPDAPAVRALAPLFELIPVLPREAIEWLLASGAYRWIPRGTLAQRLGRAAITVAGDVAMRERFRTILLGAAWAAMPASLRARLRPADPPAPPEPPPAPRPAGARARLPVVPP